MTTLLDYLANAALRNPSAVAVAEAARRLSYAELTRASNTLAAQLTRNGVGPGRRVVIQLPAGADLVIAIWAVLKTGAAYVPLDPALPEARIKLLLDRVRPQTIVALAAGVRYGISTVDVRAAYGHTQQPPAVTVKPDDPAYILHTSGSTGVPKGVVLTHRNAMAFVDWAVDEFQFVPSDRIAGHAPAHFDLSVLDLFGVAKAGATLLPVPTTVRMFGAELARFLAQSRATVLYCVPTALTMLSDAATSASLESLRCVLFAGEVCPQSTLRAMTVLAPHIQYANLYGPTETNVCTYHRVTSPDLHQPALPIGQAITGVTTRVMATPEREAAVGELGELYVAGPTVAVGYWNDPQQTAERFVETSFGRAYRTGDTVVRSDDGNLYFRGRRDRQVKTRGHRVELDEVEMVLRALPSIVEVAVFAIADESVSHRIVAAVITHDSAVTAGQLRRACAARLPSYAVPSIFRIMKEFPLTSTGKLDRTALSVRLASSTPVESVISR